MLENLNVYLEGFFVEAINRGAAMFAAGVAIVGAILLVSALAEIKKQKH